MGSDRKHGSTKKRQSSGASWVRKQSKPGKNVSSDYSDVVAGKAFVEKVQVNKNVTFEGFQENY